MQTYSIDGVRQERTGWRDQGISERHRQWGFNCPAVDLDFLMVEYNKGIPVGLVEYKHFKAMKPNLKHATYRALVTLAETSGLPFVIAFYWPDTWAFRVYPINDTAKRHFKSEYEDMSEMQFVTRLYKIRYLAVGQELTGKLNTMLPPKAHEVAA